MASRIKSYGLAVLLTALAWLADTLLKERFPQSSGGLYVAAALISTWVGGLGPGLLAMALTAAINLIFFDRPYLSLSVGVHGFDRLVFFTALALVVSLLRRNQTILKEVNSKPEEKVKMRTAALNESNKQLEAFCYTLAHDLRAPSRAIQGFADMLVTDHGEELGEQVRQELERIRNSAERMGRLTLDLITYTDLSRADYRKQPVDLAGVCRNVLRLFSDEIIRTKADVAVDVSSEQVLADPAGVERVLVNLFGNALKFTQPGRSPAIRLSAERRNGSVCVSVEDNGVGLDPKYRERIFGVFERLSSASGATGTGIGLAIVKRSVEKMGGTVGVESEPGKGSRFWFELPKAAAPAALKSVNRSIPEQLPEQKTDRLVGHAESHPGK